ncbi:uncharacterized protein FOMMEDRAFT_139329 [Fomitiporia mediterranea MF3/22]|uniref:uncharacterized protein n=1 Tax=Fomitiporia mediterranea (strain MF3/22) TaxID=694068 RepID=UPI00044096AA|nr:uncharacterized protein FOMMEDRAFT_139329 [Fomitiporia mediterranea MF3/22]EJD06041.1 hypothetical protein FOMMEDRAFT_139329 [Fomitiporia mediterranea MF3/22]
MSTMEAAASLFGSSDSGSDLDFLTAPEGANSASDSPAGTGAATSNELFASQDSSSLFDNGSAGAEHSLFEARNEAHAHVHEHNSTHFTQAEAYPSENANGYRQDAQSDYNSDGAGYGSIDEGWFDEHGQWHTFDQLETTASTGIDASSNTAEHHAGATNASPYAGYSAAGSQYGTQSASTPSTYAYQPDSNYVPQSTSAYDTYKPATPTVQQQSYASGYNSSATSHDPYKPSGFGSQQAPTSTYTAPTVPPYDSYRPSASHTYSTPAAPPSAVPQSNRSVSSGGLMSPATSVDTSKPPASIYRPTTANAYDPPLPPVKPKKSMAANALQFQSSSYSPQGVSSPLLSPARSAFSPPAGNSTFSPGPPPRSTVRSPPKAPGVSYAQPASTVERSASPYDPPLARQPEPPKPHAFDTYNRAGPPQINGQHEGSGPYGRPELGVQNMNYSSDNTHSSQEYGGLSSGFTPNYDNSSQFSGHDAADRTIVQSNISQGQHSAHSGQYTYSPSSDSKRSSQDQHRTSSRPISPESHASPKEMHHSPPIERHARMSPDVASRSGGSQYTISPVSESGQSYTGSLGRGSPVNSRAGTMLVGQSFSTLDKETHSEPYTLSTQVRQQPDALPYTASNYNVLAAAPSFTTFADAPGRTSFETSYSPPPVNGPYAPSPSLLGTNDPLGRASAKVPVISFGFGGKLVTCFHSPPVLDTGFDVALSSRKCTDVHIWILQKAIPESALDASSAVYPGPLFGDPGSPVSTIVRTATSANTKAKTKKAKVLTYLSERAEEIEKGLGYLTAGSVDRRRAEGKLTLVRLLRVLVEHDGQLHENSAAESDAREALLPRLATSQDATGSNVYLNAPTGAALTSGTFGSANSTEKPLAEYAVRSSALEVLQDFLLRGEKRKAYHYALDERMWAHAMVISSSIDKEAFKEVVSEFVRTELGVKAGTRPDAHVTNGYESLRLAYSLYSGQSSSAVQHLVPTKSLQAGPSLTIQPPTPMNHMTPLSPNFPSPSQATNIPHEILSQWQEYAVMLFSGQMGVESSSALTTLGDYLLSNDWVEAAHCCYLLAPQSSPIGGVGAPSVRVVLVGVHSPHRNVHFAADPDSFIFSEILEFALSLHTPAKGQEAFPGFPHLQVYRLIRAVQLAEMGQVALAKRYCDAITGTAFRPSPYLSQLFSDQLRELCNRLSGDPELDKANSWIGGKIAKPSLDGIGDWIGGRLSKFVAGEAEPSSPVAGEHPMAPAYSGAFSHFSNISSTNNSRGSSPVPGLANNSAPPSTVAGRIAASSVTANSTSAYAPYNRASSAMGLERPDSRKNTPPPSRVLSADATKTSFGQSQSLAQAANSYGYGDYGNGHHFANGDANHQEEVNKPAEGGGWWSAAYGGADTATPTATAFSNADPHAIETESGGSGFISLTDNYNSYTPSPSTSKKGDENDDFDEEDALGLGNSTARKKKETPQEDEDGSTEVKEEVKKEEPKKPDPKPNAASSSSWFGRLFSRPSSTNPGPVKAKLGEESSFYYDKDLKRWVNKNAGAEAAKPAAPPPPPSRAQTASPSRSMQPSSSGPPPASPMPPPGRPLSAIDKGSSAPPKRELQRARSNLVPVDGADSSAPPTPTVMSSFSAPPPTGNRPKSAAKKSVRSRYVDVFQQPS